MESKQCHVMVFPWLAFGHIIPSFELSKRLAAKGMKISFISTRRNIDRLPGAGAPTDNIKMVEIDLPSINGLPQNCQATIDLQTHEIQYLKKAVDGLQSQFERIVGSDLPDIVLFDFVQYWVPQACCAFGVSCGYLSAFSASTLAFIGPPNETNRRSHVQEFTKPPQWFDFPSLVAHRPDQAAIMFNNIYFSDVSGTSSGHRFGKTLQTCDFVAVRSCTEFEGPYLSLLERLYQKPVLPIGILPPNPKSAEHHRGSADWSDMFNWLDKQATKSVVFVGFGSEYKMPVEEIHELARGIELSQLPFVWILRKTEGVVDGCDLLPPGFLEQTGRSRGKVCFGWAPQIEILGHAAIGGCLFHSGWGTVIESLSFGHPQILMPMVSDQGLVAKLLVEKGIGFEVQRNQDGSFQKDDVAMALRHVMVDQQGLQLRSQAANMTQVFSSQDLQDDYTGNFIHFLCNYKKPLNH